MLVESEENQFALAKLFAQVSRADTRWLVWVGAGASRWCGFQSWQDLADRIHSFYCRTSSTYDRTAAAEAFVKADFPKVFQLCSDADPQAYARFIAEAHAIRPVTPVYERFLQALRRFDPLGIITTNIDELLEKNLATTVTIGREDIEQALDNFQRRQSFLFKVHGSASSINSLVFRSSDYDGLAASEAWIENLARLLAGASVLFVGYGLRDQYLLNLLKRIGDFKPLLGYGPHFAILPESAPRPPDGIVAVRYVASPNTDHRSTLDVLDEIGNEFLQPNKLQVAEHPVTEPTLTMRSAHLLFDVLVAGTHQSSQTAKAESASGDAIEITYGAGFVDDELPHQTATAMHDVLVGLLCFEKVVMSIHNVGRVHELLGSSRFWRLFEEGALEFVEWSHETAVVSREHVTPAIGGLGSMQVHNPNSTRKDARQAIRQQLIATTGREQEADRLFTQLEKSTRLITDDEELGIPNIVRSLLLRPSVRRLIGLSEGTPLNNVPVWQRFPVLRLARVARIAATCRLLQIPSAKLDFGTSLLAGPAFSARPGREWADQVAGFVVGGMFSCDLGRLVMSDGALIDAVISFRQTSIASELRAQVLSCLQSNSGADVSIAVNSALKASLPYELLQRARDAFTRLNVPTGSAVSGGVMLWTDQRAEEAIRAWRRRSNQLMKSFCRDQKVSAYDRCPCGSGEKLRFCCAQALDS